MKARSTLLAFVLAGLLVTSDTVMAQPGKSTCCDLKSDMRMLWEDHIVWTRNVIFNIIDELPGTEAAVARLLQNQVDIGNAIKPYYGEAAGNQLTSLLQQHITIAADLLTALDDGNTAALNAANAQWLANADAIATFLSGANPAWAPEEMKAMMREHLALTTQEAIARKEGNYAADVVAYDAVHQQVLQMADMLSEGIISQFPNRFRGCAEGKHVQAATVPGHGISLGQNTPNPVSSGTIIPYQLPAEVRQAQVILYDRMGRTVKAIDIRTRGEGILQLDLSNLGKGVYKYSLIADGTLVDTKTMVR